MNFANPRPFRHTCGVLFTNVFFPVKGLEGEDGHVICGGNYFIIFFE